MEATLGAVAPAIVDPARDLEPVFDGDPLVATLFARGDVDGDPELERAGVDPDGLVDPGGDAEEGRDHRL